MMEELRVSLEREGRQVPVGTIRDGAFRYLEEYLSFPDAAPISISLPLENGAFTKEQTKCFFDGLLPEGFTRRTVAGILRVAEDDYLSLLKNLGSECLGALQIRDVGAADDSLSYEPLSKKKVAKLASEGAAKSADLVVEARLSLTGASGKVGLLYDEKSGKWYLPRGIAPSTHIVKQSHIRYDGIVANEQLCLMTAEKLGIAVPPSFIINTGKASDKDVLLATKRYDRVPGKFTAEEGILIPLRLHQEDMAQALGISASDKYEPEGGNYLRKMMHLLADYSANPIADQIRLWDLVIFNFLAGNTDNHIKNISLLYDSSFKSLRLAPSYDLISTAVYDNATRKMSLSADGQYDIDSLTEENFEAEAAGDGLGKRVFRSRWQAMCGGFEAALKSSAEELREAGFSKAGEIRNRILKRGGYARLYRKT